MLKLCWLYTWQAAFFLRLQQLLSSAYIVFRMNISTSWSRQHSEWEDSTGFMRNNICVRLQASFRFTGIVNIWLNYLSQCDLLLTKW